MRRRTFIASGLTVMANVAAEALSGMVHAQPATSPVPPAAPQGKWIKLAPLPQGTGELLGVAINGKLYASQGLLPGFKPAGLLYDTIRRATGGHRKRGCPIRFTMRRSRHSMERCMSSEDSIFQRLVR